MESSYFGVSARSLFGLVLWSVTWRVGPVDGDCVIHVSRALTTRRAAQERTGGVYQNFCRVRDERILGGPRLSMSRVELAEQPDLLAAAEELNLLEDE
jgi:hypothetical protein